MKIEVTDHVIMANPGYSSLLVLDTSTIKSYTPIINIGGVFLFFGNKKNQIVRNPGFVFK
jgi:hypothetical protein